MNIHAHLGWPQVIYLVLLLTGWGVTLARYGEPHRGNYDFTDLVIAPAIAVSLLYWGGFFG